MKTKKTYRDMIGDGKMPNKYWVALSNDYMYHHQDGKDNMVDWIGDIVPTFKSEGLTIEKPFSTYEKAKKFCDEIVIGEVCSYGFIVNRINIEDRLSGELYEKTKIFYPNDCSVEDWETEDFNFTKKTMEAKEKVFK
jgi:hypothetical protein